MPVGELQFDRFNPRLLGQNADASDEFIIAQLYRSAELDELLQSVSTNGYLDIEPLIVLANSTAARVWSCWKVTDDSLPSDYFVKRT